VCRAFQLIQQLRYVVIVEAGGKSKVPRSYYKRLAMRLLGSYQSEAEKMVDYLFERGAGSPALFIQEAGNVVVQRKGGSHILMLCQETS
jgi:hypothetical protein